MKRVIAIIAVATALLMQGGCSMKKMTTNTVGAISTEGIAALEREEDVAFARESLPALIKTLEVFHYGNLSDVRTLTLLSQSYGIFAFGFLEEEMLRQPAEGPGRATAASRVDTFYRRGKEFGLQALSTSSAFKQSLEAPLPAFQKAVGGLGKKYVGALFWTAFNWANWMNLHRDDPSAIVDLPRVQALVDRVIALDPEYNCGSAHAIRGVVASSRPKMLGGDLELAQKEFAEAQRIAPDYLMTRVLQAQYYARQAGDPALFAKTLGEVKEADAAAMPSQRLSNELAKRRAVILLAQQKNLF